MIDLPAITLDEIQAIRDQNLVVDFWAPWCGSCRLLAPTVRALSEELSASARFFQVDVDAWPEIADALGVMSVPTVVAFRDGQELVRSSGMTSRQALHAELMQALT